MMLTQAHAHTPLPPSLNSAHDAAANVYVDKVIRPTAPHPAPQPNPTPNGVYHQPQIPSLQSGAPHAQPTYPHSPPSQPFPPHLRPQLIVIPRPSPSSSLTGPRTSLQPHSSTMSPIPATASSSIANAATVTSPALAASPSSAWLSSAPSRRMRIFHALSFPACHLFTSSRGSSLSVTDFDLDAVVLAAGGGAEGLEAALNLVQELDREGLKLATIDDLNVTLAHRHQTRQTIAQLTAAASAPTPSQHPFGIFLTLLPPSPSPSDIASFVDRMLVDGMHGVDPALPLTDVLKQLAKHAHTWNHPTVNGGRPVTVASFLDSLASLANSMRRRVLARHLLSSASGSALLSPLPTSFTNHQLATLLRACHESLFWTFRHLHHAQTELQTATQNPSDPPHHTGDDGGAKDIPSLVRRLERMHEESTGLPPLPPLPPSVSDDSSKVPPSQPFIYAPPPSSSSSSPPPPLPPPSSSTVTVTVTQSDSIPSSVASNRDGNIESDKSTPVFFMPSNSGPPVLQSIPFYLPSSNVSNPSTVDAELSFMQQQFRQAQAQSQSSGTSSSSDGDCGGSGGTVTFPPLFSVISPRAAAIAELEALGSPKEMTMASPKQQPMTLQQVQSQPLKSVPSLPSLIDPILSPSSSLVPSSARTSPPLHASLPPRSFSVATHSTKTTVPPPTPSQASTSGLFFLSSPPLHSTPTSAPTQAQVRVATAGPSITTPRTQAFVQSPPHTMTQVQQTLQLGPQSPPQPLQRSPHPHPQPQPPSHPPPPQVFTFVRPTSPLRTNQQTQQHTTHTPQQQHQYSQQQNPPSIPSYQPPPTAPPAATSPLPSHPLRPSTSYAPSGGMPHPQSYQPKAPIQHPPPSQSPHHASFTPHPPPSHPSPMVSSHSLPAPSQSSPTPPPPPVAASPETRLRLDRAVILSALSYPRCKLFVGATEPISLTDHHLDRLIAIAGHVDATCALLRTLEKEGVRVASVEHFMAAFEQAALNERREELVQYLLYPKCTLFTLCTRPIEIEDEDLDRLIEIAGSLQLAIRCITEFESAQRKFYSFAEMQLAMEGDETVRKRAERERNMNQRAQNHHHQQQPQQTQQIPPPHSQASNLLAPPPAAMLLSPSPGSVASSPSSLASNPLSSYSTITSPGSNFPPSDSGQSSMFPLLHRALQGVDPSVTLVPPLHAGLKPDHPHPLNGVNEQFISRTNSFAGMGSYSNNPVSPVLFSHSIEPHGKRHGH